MFSFVRCCGFNLIDFRRFAVARFWGFQATKFEGFFFGKILRAAFKLVELKVFLS